MLPTCELEMKLLTKVCYIVHAKCTCTQIKLPEVPPVPYKVYHVGCTEFLHLSKQDKKPMTKEIQQLAFINPGRLTAAGFNPEFSNREKRKLSRLMDQQNGRSEAG